MPSQRTFIDSGVLLAAFKAFGELADNALAVLGDPERQFVTSDFVRLELLPKPICYGNDSERHFYEAYFANVEQIVRASASLIEDEFVTAEKPTKPLFRVVGIKVSSVRPPN